MLLVETARTSTASSSRAFSRACLTPGPGKLPPTAQILDWDAYELTNLLDQINSSLIRQIVVICGAGISTPSGIADFRSPRTGLYENVACYNLPYPEALFEMPYFKRNPKPFFQYYKELMLKLQDDRFKPNVVHKFLALLHSRKQLLRVYTQNIDGLELAAGLPQEVVVQSHGHLRTASCVSCAKKFTKDFLQLSMRNNCVPFCNGCRGLVKPDVTFFGEDLHPRFWTHRHDLDKADAVFIMGTSLSVEPFSYILRSIPRNCPVILFNNRMIHAFKHQLSQHQKRIFLDGDLVESILKLVNILRWEHDLANYLPPPKQQEQASIGRKTSAASATDQSFYDKWSSLNRRRRASQSAMPSSDDRCSSICSSTSTTTISSSSANSTAKQVIAKKRVSFSVTPQTRILPRIDSRRESLPTLIENSKTCQKKKTTKKHPRGKKKAKGSNSAVRRGSTSSARLPTTKPRSLSVPSLVVPLKSPSVAKEKRTGLDEEHDDDCNFPWLGRVFAEEWNKRQRLNKKLAPSDGKFETSKPIGRQLRSNANLQSLLDELDAISLDDYE